MNTNSKKTHRLFNLFIAYITIGAFLFESVFAYAVPGEQKTNRCLAPKSVFEDEEFVRDIRAAEPAYEGWVDTQSPQTQVMDKKADGLIPAERAVISKIEIQREIKEDIFGIKDNINTAADAWKVIFENNENAGKFFSIASRLRIIYPFDLTKDSPLPPLQYARKNGIVFKIGPNLFMTPVTESFRRHIVFGENEKGGVKFAFEVLIPGDRQDRRETFAQKRGEIAKKLLDEYSEKRLCAEPLSVKEFSEGVYDFYGENIVFDKEHPLNVIAFNYDEDGKRMEFVSREMLDGLASEIGVSRDELDRTIAYQVAEITAAVHLLGYVGHEYVDGKVHIDHHLGNLRLIMNNGGIKIILAGDFDAYVSKSRYLNSLHEEAVDIEKIILSRGGNVPGLKDILRMHQMEIYTVFKRVKERMGTGRGDSSETSGESRFEAKAVISQSKCLFSKGRVSIRKFMEQTEMRNITGAYKHIVSVIIKNYLYTKLESGEIRSIPEGKRKELMSYLDGLRMKECAVYGINSVVESNNDFFFGGIDVRTDTYKLFIDDGSLIPHLKTLEMPALVYEYIMHLVICPVLGHYAAILIQQELFPSHYPDKKKLKEQTPNAPYEGLVGDKIKQLVKWRMLHEPIATTQLDIRDKERSVQGIIEAGGVAEIEPVTAALKAASFDWGGVLSLAVEDEEECVNIKRLLTFLRDAGIEIFVVTKGNTGDVWDEIKETGLSEFIDRENVLGVYADTDVNHLFGLPVSKREVLKQICGWMGISYDEIIHFDDTLTEIKDIKGTAVTVSVATNHHLDISQVLQSGPNYIIGGFGDLEKIREIFNRYKQIPVFENAGKAESIPHVKDGGFINAGVLAGISVVLLSFAAVVYLWPGVSHAVNILGILMPFVAGVVGAVETGKKRAGRNESNEAVIDNLTLSIIRDIQCGIDPSPNLERMQEYSANIKVFNHSYYLSLKGSEGQSYFSDFINDFISGLEYPGLYAVINDLLENIKHVSPLTPLIFAVVRDGEYLKIVVRDGGDAAGGARIRDSVTGRYRAEGRTHAYNNTIDAFVRKKLKGQFIVEFCGKRQRYYSGIFGQLKIEEGLSYIKEGDGVKVALLIPRKNTSRFSAFSVSRMGLLQTFLIWAGFIGAALFAASSARMGGDIASYSWLPYFGIPLIAGAVTKKKGRGNIIRGTLPRNGRLEAGGRTWGKFTEYAGSEYELEMKDNFPVKIYFNKDGCTKEFFPIVDNKTGRVIDVHIGKITKEKFEKYEDVTIYTKLAKEGKLDIGGGKPFVNGDLPHKARTWARFGPEHEGERVKIIVRKGVIYRCTSCDSDLDEEFRLVWNKEQNRYTTSFWDKLTEDEFNLMDEDYEIHNFSLSKGGLLNIGNMQGRIIFGRRFECKKVNITDIRNSNGKAFIVSASVVENGQVIAVKKLSAVYEAKDTDNPEQFVKGDLTGVFEKLNKRDLTRRDGTVLDSYIISDIRADGEGAFEAGGYWLRVDCFPNAEVEGIAINGEKRFVKFIRDKDGNPILDIDGNSLVIDVRGNVQRQVMERSNLYQGKSLSGTEAIYDEGVGLFSEGKYEEAVGVFNRLIRMIRKKTISVKGNEALTQEAGVYLEQCRAVLKKNRVKQKTEGRIVGPGTKRRPAEDPLTDRIKSLAVEIAKEKKESAKLRKEISGEQERWEKRIDKYKAELDKVEKERRKRERIEAEKMLVRMERERIKAKKESARSRRKAKKAERLRRIEEAARERIEREREEREKKEREEEEIKSRGLLLDGLKREAEERSAPWMKNGKNVSPLPRLRDMEYFASVELNRNNGHILTASPNGSAYRANLIFMEFVQRAIDYFIEKTQEAGTEDYLKNILELPRNKAVKKIILKTIRSGPLDKINHTALGRNSARYYNSGMGELVIVFDMDFVSLISRYEDEFPEAARWIFIERLLHELCHDNENGDNGAEMSEEIDIIFKNDLFLYMNFVYGKDLGSTIDNLWKIIPNGDKARIMRSRAFYGMLKLAVETDEKLRQGGMKEYGVRRQFINEIIITPFVNRLCFGNREGKGFPSEAESPKISIVTESDGLNGIDSIEVIDHSVPAQNKPILAVFDAHGTLLQPTWKDEYRAVYRELTNEELSSDWIDKNIIHKTDVDIIRALAEVSGKDEGLVKESIKRVRAKIRNGVHTAMPGVLEFVKALNSRGVPIAVISGSPRELILRQLKEAEFLEYIPEENIVGRYEGDRQKYNRAKVVEALKQHYPNHTIVYFDDWISGIEEVRKLGGICFGVPQGEGREFDNNRAALINVGINYILYNWNDWRDLDRFLTIKPKIQKKDYKIPVSKELAQQLVTVLPSPRHNHIGLHIDISDDLKWITYSMVEDDSHVFKEDGATDYSALKIKKLIAIPSSYLVTPQRYIEEVLPVEMKEVLLRLLGQGKRYIRYKGISTSWDVETDVDVWATNIDTVFMHSVLEESGILDNPSIKSAVEAGVGGGHLSCLLAARLPNLKKLSIIDISIYALRAAKRCLDAYSEKGTDIKTYLGKGLRNVEDKVDLIIANPPYIPIPPFMDNDANDPYRGTGLIKEIIEIGEDKLNSNNPEASIFINISSMAQRDFDRYVEEFRDKYVIEKVGQSIEVPLKISTINSEWKDWLVKEGLLKFKPNVGPGEESYWHTIQVYRIRVKARVPVGLIDAPEMQAGAERKEDIDSVLREVWNIEGDPGEAYRFFGERILPLRDKDIFLEELLKGIVSNSLSGKRLKGVLDIVYYLFSYCKAKTYELEITKEQYLYLWRIYDVLKKGGNKDNNMITISLLMAQALQNKKVRIIDDPDKKYALSIAREKFAEFIDSLPADKSSEGIIHREQTWLYPVMALCGDAAAEIMVRFLQKTEGNGLLYEIALDNLIAPLCAQSEHARRVFSVLFASAIKFTPPSKKIDTKEKAWEYLFGGKNGDNGNTRLFLKLATMLRIVYPYKLNNKDIRPPLRYALDNNIIYEICPGLFMSPVTESFRRQSIFGMDEKGGTTFSFEVIIPGEDVNRRNIGAEKRYRTAKYIRKVSPDSCVAPFRKAKLPSGIYDLYGKKMEFTDQEPLQVVAFDYNEDGKRLENFTPEMLDALIKELNLPLSRGQLDLSIARQAAEIISVIHFCGYVGRNKESNTDCHIGNLRMIPAGGGVKLKLVGDFESFRNQSLFKEPEREMDEDFKTIINGCGIIRGLKNILTTLSEEELYQIFKKEREALRQKEAPGKKIRATAKPEIDELLGQGELGLLSLHRKLRAEEKGEINGKHLGLRRYIWDRILGHSFNGQAIRYVNREGLPGEYEDIKALGRMVIRGYLGAEGLLKIGKEWATFGDYAKGQYELEMKDGIPVRIFFLKDASAKEFLPIVDNRTGEVIDAYNDSIKREEFERFEDVTIYADLVSEGGLWIGGGRPDINGEVNGKQRAWARFGEKYTGERVKVVVRKGVIYNCKSVESGLDKEFALVWDKIENRYTTSFRGGMFEEEFNRFNENYEIHNFALNRFGCLYLGGRPWAFFKPEKYGGKRVDIVDIQNSSGAKAFIMGMRVRVDGFEKRLSVIYEVPDNGPDDAFEKTGIFDVFDKWNKSKSRRADGTYLNKYIITRIYLHGSGVLHLDGTLGTFSYFPNAEVEVKFINEKARFVKFVKNKQGEPILDVLGQSLILDLEKNIRSQLEEKWPPGVAARKEREERQAERLSAKAQMKEAKKIAREARRERDAVRAEVKKKRAEQKKATRTSYAGGRPEAEQETIVKRPGLSKDARELRRRIIAEIAARRNGKPDGNNMAIAASGTYASEQHGLTNENPDNVKGALLIYKDNKRIFAKIRADLANIGYGAKAGGIINALGSIEHRRQAGKMKVVDYNFMLALEKLLDYPKGSLSGRVNAAELEKKDNAFERKFSGIFGLNMRQWDLTKQIKGKKTIKGIIAQDISGIGPGFVNWLEGLKRHGVNIDGLQFAFIAGGEDAKNIRESQAKLSIQFKGVKIIVRESLEAVIRDYPDNIVYLADGEGIGGYKDRYRDIKIVEKGHAGPVIELNLCLTILPAGNMDELKASYRDFLGRLVEKGFITREQIDVLIEDIEKDGFIKLPDVKREVLEMWEELERGSSYKDYIGESA